MTWHESPDDKKARELLDATLVEDSARYAKVAAILSAMQSDKIQLYSMPVSELSDPSDNGFEFASDDNPSAFVTFDGQWYSLQIGSEQISFAEKEWRIFVRNLHAIACPICDHEWETNPTREG